VRKTRNEEIVSRPVIDVECGFQREIAGMFQVNPMWMSFPAALEIDLDAPGFIEVRYEYRESLVFSPARM